MQFNLVILFVLGGALTLTTFAMGRTARSTLSRQVGENMQAQAASVSDILHHFYLERVGQLQVLALSNEITIGVVDRNAAYSPNLVTVSNQISALDKQWRMAGDDDQLIGTITSRDPLVNPVAAELHFFLAALPEHTELIVTDKYGATVAATNRLTDYAQGDEVWWQSAWQHGRGTIYLSLPQIDESAGVEAILIAVPIYDSENGNVVGVIRSTLRADHLFGLVEQQTFGRTGQANLITAGGYPMGATTDAGSLGSAQAVLAQMNTTGSASGYLPYTDEEGQDLLIAYAPVPRPSNRLNNFLERSTSQALLDQGLVVIVEQSANEALLSINQIAWTSAFVGGGMLLLAAVSGILLTRAVTRPLLHLTNVVESFNIEDAPVPLLVTSNDETGRLTDSFMRLGENLRQTIHDLEVQIGELERAEAALRLSENRYRSLIDTVPVAIYTKDRAGVYTSANDNMRSLWPIDPIGQTDETLMPPATANQTGAVEAQVLAKGELMVIEQAVPGPHGERYLLSRVGPLRDADNEIVGILGASIDITTRKLLEQTLMESVAHRARQVETSTAVAQQIAAAPVMAELFERVVTLVQQQFGYYHAQVYTLDAVAADADPLPPRYLVLQAGTGLTSQQLLAAGHRIPLATRRSLVARAAQTGRPVIVPDVTREPAWLPNALLPETRAEIAVPIKLGEQILGVLDVQNNSVNSLGAEDELLLSGLCGQIAVAIDYRRAEHALQLYSTELEEMVNARTRELREAQSDLVRQERLAVLGQLAAGIGHELRNPLGVVNNAVYLLSMILEDEATGREYLGMIANRVTAMEQIIGGLIDFATTAPLAPQPVAVTTLLESALSLGAESAAGQAPIDVELAISADLPKVFVDRAQVTRALVNILINAWQAQDETGQVRVTAWLQREFVAIAIKDDGPGVAAAALEQAFEPLFSTKVHGIGLGLPAARNLVEINGGRLELRSKIGAGTEVVISLPVSLVEAPDAIAIN